MRGNPSKRSRNNNYRPLPTKTPALTFTSSQSRAGRRTAAARPYFQTVTRQDNSKTVQCADNAVTSAQPGGPGGSCQNISINGSSQGRPPEERTVVPASEQVEHLREELNKKVAEVQQLDEEVFLLKAQLSCKDAEDKFNTKNSQQVQNLKDELAFKARELERLQGDSRKLRVENERLRQLAEQRPVKKAKIVANAPVAVPASVPSSSQVRKKYVREESVSLDRRFVSLASLSTIAGMHSIHLFEVLRECGTDSGLMLYNTLISNHATLMPWKQMESLLNDVVNELIAMLDKTVAASHALRKLLLSMTRFSFPLSDPRALKVFAVVVDRDLSESRRDAALGILLVMAQKPSKPSGVGKSILKALQSESFEHNGASLELFSSLLGTQVKESEDGEEWPLPNCALLFQKCGDDTDGVIAVCSTLVAVLGDRAIRELCKQAVIRELVNVLNAVSLLSQESGRNDHALMRSASLLLSVLIKYDLEFEVDRTWKRLELISVIHLVSNTYPDIEEALHQYLDGLMTL